MKKEQKTKRKNFKGVLLRRIAVLFIAAVFFGTICPVVLVKAAEPEVIQMSQIMLATEAVAMKEEPRKEAKTLMTYEENASIFVTGETENGWYQVFYQGMTGYVPKQGLQEQAVDAAGIDAEMAIEEAETTLVLETVEQYRAESRRSKIWGSIIIALVVGIFGVGIVSMIKANKEEAAVEKEKEQEAEENELIIEEINS